MSSKAQGNAPQKMILMHEAPFSAGRGQAVTRPHVEDPSRVINLHIAYRRLSALIDPALCALCITSELCTKEI
jgi:hypothetical protein